MASYYETAKNVQIAEKAQRETARQAFRIADCARMYRAYSARLALALERSNSDDVAKLRATLQEIQTMQENANKARLRAFARWNSAKAKLGNA